MDKNGRMGLSFQDHEVVLAYVQAVRRGHHVDARKILRANPDLHVHFGQALKQEGILKRTMGT